ncbi:MAG: cyclic nucleotide-binding domain-containing protein [Stenotrophobium sp.]
MFDKPAVQALIEQAHKRSYPAKHTIVHAGSEPQSLYLILEGSVSIFLEDEHGREIVLAYLNPGDFFGEMCLFPEQKVRTAGVRTRRETLVAETSYQTFRQFSHEHPEIMYELAGQLSRRLRDTSQRLRELTFVDVAGRVAHTLLELSRQPGAMPHDRGVVVRISRQELSSNVGCSREMAGRVLKKLQEDGVVSCQGRNVLVLSTRKR